MKKYQAPHEILTDEQIKENIETLLIKLSCFEKRWNASDWEVWEFQEFIKGLEETLFKLRREQCKLT